MASSIRLLVLGAVRIFQPVHGYDVRRELVSWRVDQWANVAPGSIYNAIKTLTREGCLEVVGTDQVGGRPERTRYKLTDEGDKQFQELLRETWWDLRPPLDPLMPGLCFMPFMTKDEAIAALEHRLTCIEGLRKHGEFAMAEMARNEKVTPPHVRELYRLSMARVGAEVDWAKALIAALKRGEYIGNPRGLPVPRKRARRRPA